MNTRYELPAEETEITVLDYWRIVWRRRWSIAVVCVASALVSFVYSLTLPKIYEATATVLTPQESGPATQLSVSLGGRTGMAGGGESGLGGVALQIAEKANLEMFLAILESKTLRLELGELLKQKWGQLTGDLVGRKIDAGKVTISVKVEAKEPRLAADAANLYVEALQGIVERLSMDRREEEQKFAADRLSSVWKGLQAAEDSLKQFQLKNRFLTLDPQTRGAVDAGAGLRAMVIAAELDLERMRQFLTDSHPDVTSAKRNIQELKRQLSQAQFGEPMLLPPPENRRAGSPRKEFYVPTVRQPELQLELIHLYRNVRIQEALYTLLLQQIEIFKLSKVGQGPGVQFLDRATPPDKPSRPRIVFNVTVATGVTLVAAIFLTLFLAYLERLRSLERARRVA